MNDQGAGAKQAIELVDMTSSERRAGKYAHIGPRLLKTTVA